MSNDEPKPSTPEAHELDEASLEAVSGGIAAMLPAVQKVEEANGVVDAADYNMWRSNFGALPRTR